MEEGMVVCSKTGTTTNTHTIIFPRVQLCGTGLSPTVDTRAVVRDVGPTLPRSLEVSHEADIKEAMYLLSIK